MSSTNKVVVFCTIAVVTLSILSSTAMAQQRTDGEVMAENLMLTSTTGLTTTAVGGGVILTVILVSDDGGNDDMEAYLRHNAVNVQHDLHVGGGETTRDLASMFAIPDDQLDDFSSILYDNRHSLASLTEPGQIDGDDARQFRQILIGEMLDHETLSIHLRQQAT